MEPGLNYDASVSAVSGDASSSAAVGGIDPALWEPQELGEISMLGILLCQILTEVQYSTVFIQ